MKKLKLYGEKKRFFRFKRKGFVAEVFVEGDEIRVSAGDSCLEKELKNEIDRRMRSNCIVSYRSVWEMDRGQRIHYSIAEPRKPGDPDFLEALKDFSAFWHTQTFAGYEISGVRSKIVDE